MCSYPIYWTGSFRCSCCACFARWGKNIGSWFEEEEEQEHQKDAANPDNLVGEDYDKARDDRQVHRENPLAGAKEFLVEETRALPPVIEMEGYGNSWLIKNAVLSLLEFEFRCFS